MKTPPRSLLASKKLTLPSGLDVSVLPSPSLIKLVQLGKIPPPVIKTWLKNTSTEIEVETAPAEELVARLTDSAAFTRALVLAVVDVVHYKDEDGTVYDLPLADDNERDDVYPYDVLSQEDVSELAYYAQEGATLLATFPAVAGRSGNSEDSADVAVPTKRAARSK